MRPRPPLDCRNMTDAIIKRCGCGAMYNRAQWNALERPKVSTMEGDPGEVLHYRHCVCGSTITVLLEPVLPSPPIDRYAPEGATEGWAEFYGARKPHYTVFTDRPGGGWWTTLCGKYTRATRPLGLRTAVTDPCRECGHKAQFRVFDPNSDANAAQRGAFNG